MCKVYTGYCGTSEIEHGLCACTVDNRGLSLCTGAQPMLYLPHRLTLTFLQQVQTSFYLFYVLKRNIIRFLWNC